MAPHQHAAGHGMIVAITGSARSTAMDTIVPIPCLDHHDGMTVTAAMTTPILCLDHGMTMTMAMTMPMPCYTPGYEHGMTVTVAITMSIPCRDHGRDRAHAMSPVWLRPWP